MRILYQTKTHTELGTQAGKYILNVILTTNYKEIHIVKQNNKWSTIDIMYSSNKLKEVGQIPR